MHRPQREEIVNSLTHALATVLAAAAGVWLVLQVNDSGNTPLVVACAVYGVGLVGVFLSSALSHCAMTDKGRSRFRQLDQAFIYILIVATYTPFSIVHLRSPFWWGVLALMWLIAIGGFLSKVMFVHRVDSASVLGYVALGWIPAMAGLPFSDLVPREAMYGIIAGGVLYTAGTLFLLNDRRVWYFHAVWHLFVVAGAAVHFWTTIEYVI